LPFRSECCRTGCSGEPLARSVETVRLVIEPTPDRRHPSSAARQSFIGT